MEGFNVLCWILSACIAVPITGAILIFVLEQIIKLVEWIKKKK